MNTKSVQNAELDMLKGGGTYIYHFAVKVEVKHECEGALSDAASSIL
jgi:hypothetical protein